MKRFWPNFAACVSLLALTACGTGETQTQTAQTLTGEDTTMVLYAWESEPMTISHGNCLDKRDAKKKCCFARYNIPIYLDGRYLTADQDYTFSFTMSLIHPGTNGPEVSIMSADFCPEGGTNYNNSVSVEFGEIGLVDDSLHRTTIPVRMAFKQSSSAYDVGGGLCVVLESLDPCAHNPEISLIDFQLSSNDGGDYTLNKYKLPTGFNWCPESACTLPYNQ